MLALPSSPVPSGTRNRFLLAGLVSLAAWILLRSFFPGPSIPWTPEMTTASRTMASTVSALSRHCRELGIQPVPGLDPNGTCLVGPELSPLVTSLGQLEAKRTTTNPDVAGLLVHLLKEAGVELGDVVAIGASGSFPALLLATLAAVDALGARPRTILSLGASSYGATRPEHHLLDLHGFLEGTGLVSGPPLAVSLGGEGDEGENMDPGFRTGLLEELRESEIRMLLGPDLRSNVEERMALYGSPAAFVNIGGAEATMGVSPKVLSVPPGLVEEGVEPPSREQRGVLFEMLGRGVPVLHLLHVRGLVLRYDLPWDPRPLPQPGSAVFRDGRAEKGVGFWLLSGAYVGGLILVAFGRAPGRKGKDQDQTVR